MCTIDVQIHSPRWGHSDNYRFEFTQQTLTITMQARQAVCTQQPGRDPLWSHETMSAILSNDSIAPPEQLNDLLEYAWREWLNHNIDCLGLRTEINALADWINAITAAKPSSPFWRRYF